MHLFILHFIIIKRHQYVKVSAHFVGVVQLADYGLVFQSRLFSKTDIMSDGITSQDVRTVPLPSCLIIKSEIFTVLFLKLI